MLQIFSSLSLTQYVCLPYLIQFFEYYFWRIFKFSPITSPSAIPKTINSLSNWPYPLLLFCDYTYMYYNILANLELYSNLAVNSIGYCKTKAKQMAKSYNQLINFKLKVYRELFMSIIMARKTYK